MLAAAVAAVVACGGVGARVPVLVHLLAAQAALFAGAFAEALGVTVHDPDVDDDEADEIEFLLAGDWWYDYPVQVE